MSENDTSTIPWFSKTDWWFWRGPKPWVVMVLVFYTAVVISVISRSLKKPYNCHKNIRRIWGHWDYVGFWPTPTPLKCQQNQRLETIISPFLCSRFVWAAWRFLPFARVVFNSFPMYSTGLVCLPTNLLYRLTKHIGKYTAEWWFQIFFYVHPEPWGNDPIWRAYFSNGLVQPPTGQYIEWGPGSFWICFVFSTTFHVEGFIPSQRRIS